MKRVSLKLKENNKKGSILGELASSSSNHVYGSKQNDINKKEDEIKLDENERYVQNLALNNKFHTLNLENDYCPDDPRPNTSSYMDGTNKTTMNSLDKEDKVHFRSFSKENKSMKMDKRYKRVSILKIETTDEFAKYKSLINKMDGLLESFMCFLVIPKLELHWTQFQFQNIFSFALYDRVKSAFKRPKQSSESTTIITDTPKCETIAERRKWVQHFIKEVKSRRQSKRRNRNSACVSMDEQIKCMRKRPKKMYDYCKKSWKRLY